jgi:hypothetical protein
MTEKELKPNKPAPKRWDIRLTDKGHEMGDLLEEGWEPYAVVFVPGVGVVHYLRKLK